jgi:hypothetical protein
VTPAERGSISHFSSDPVLHISDAREENGTDSRTNPAKPKHIYFNKIVGNIMQLQITTKINPTEVLVKLEERT